MASFIFAGIPYFKRTEWDGAQAVSRNELYGYIHSASREWKEGLMSVTFREMANDKTNAFQWIVLDGDIDAEWIESMNTV